VRVFLDTNVLASAFGTRGLCADVLRLILAEHDLVLGEVVIAESRKVLKMKFGVSAPTVTEIENFLRGYHVEPRPRDLLDLPLREHGDVLVVTSALRARADVLVTGDSEMLELKKTPESLRIRSPRQFWTLATGRRQRR
jgi:uncharacterized protein